MLDDTVDDRACVEAHLQGDPAGATILFRRYNDALLDRLEHLTRCRMTAEDCLQEAWVRVLTWKGLRPSSKDFDTLLSVAARRLFFQKKELERRWRERYKQVMLVGIQGAKECRIKDCERNSLSLGLCKNHYMKYRRELERRRRMAA